MAAVTSLFGYLQELEANNNRTWYAAHRAERSGAEAEFEDLVSSLQQRVAKFVPGVLDHSAKSLTFRLQRDTRFAADKSPYNPCFRAHLGPAGKRSLQMGPYLSIRPGDRSFLGGGLFAAKFPDATRLVRDAIAAAPDRWAKLVAALPWPVRGETLKNVPRGYPADHPCAAHLKHKSWYVEVPVSDAELAAAGFLDAAVASYEAVHPLDEFLNGALSEFTLPPR
ncbi:MAG: DUF2461 domain-containing protein [Propionibacteriaceae bacterium]|nr:DUF2461 domain-containing protein [Propionibacteriaceae bacterium]